MSNIYYVRLKTKQNKKSQSYIKGFIFTNTHFRNILRVVILFNLFTRSKKYFKLTREIKYNLPTIRSCYGSSKGCSYHATKARPCKLNCDQETSFKGWSPMTPRSVHAGECYSLEYKQNVVHRRNLLFFLICIFNKIFYYILLICILNPFVFYFSLIDIFFK